MATGESLAYRIREVYLNGSWIANTNLKKELSQTSLQQALHEGPGHNSIAALTFHLSYYLEGLLPVFQGLPLNIHDAHSFQFHRPITSAEWNTQVNHLLQLAETFAILTESLPNEKLSAPFVKPEYGTWQRNIEAVIEHSYYHLGQITLLRKYTFQTPQ